MVGILVNLGIMPKDISSLLGCLKSNEFPGNDTIHNQLLRVFEEKTNMYDHKWKKHIIQLCKTLELLSVGTNVYVFKYINLATKLLEKVFLNYDTIVEDRQFIYCLFTIYQVCMANDQTLLHTWYSQNANSYILFLKLLIEGKFENLPIESILSQIDPYHIYICLSSLTTKKGKDKLVFLNKYFDTLVSLYPSIKEETVRSWLLCLQKDTDLICMTCKSGIQKLTDILQENPPITRSEEAHIIAKQICALGLTIEQNSNMLIILGKIYDPDRTKYLITNRA